MNLNRRLFVRMKLADRGHRERQRPLRADHFEAYFGHTLEVSLAPDRRRCFIGREERTGAGEFERALFIGTDAPGPDRGERVAQSIDIILRAERDDFRRFIVRKFGVCVQGANVA